MALDSAIQTELDQRDEKMKKMIEDYLTGKKAETETAKAEQRIRKSEAQQTGLINYLNATAMGRFAQESSFVSLWTLIVLVFGYFGGTLAMRQNFDLIEAIKVALGL